jgi:hypothetical protein
MLLLAAVVMAAAPAAQTANSAEKCRRTVPHYADRSGEPLKPRKLTELPPATAYMAVFRHIGACEAPLTMVDYRNPRGR